MPKHGGDDPGRGEFHPRASDFPLQRAEGSNEPFTFATLQLSTFNSQLTRVRPSGFKWPAQRGGAGGRCHWGSGRPGVFSTFRNPELLPHLERELAQTNDAALALQLRAAITGTKRGWPRIITAELNSLMEYPMTTVVRLEWPDQGTLGYGFSAVTRLRSAAVGWYCRLRKPTCANSSASSPSE